MFSPTSDLAAWLTKPLIPLHIFIRHVLEVAIQIVILEHSNVYICQTKHMALPLTPVKKYSVVYVLLKMRHSESTQQAEPDVAHRPWNARVWLRPSSRMRKHLKQILNREKITKYQGKK